MCATSDRQGTNKGKRLALQPQAITILALSFALGACAKDDPLRPPSTSQPQVNLSRAAASEIERVLNGGAFRGEQDEMLKVEARVPGFAGYYLDSLGGVVLLLKDLEGRNQAATRAAIASIFRTRETPRVVEVLGDLSNATVRSATFSLSELVGMEQAIYRSARRLPQYRGVGIHIPSNRVALNVVDSSAIEQALTNVETLGIPRSAIVPVVWGPVSAAATFSDLVRPTAGGLRVALRDLRLPDTAFLQSHGFNVYRCVIPNNPCQVDYFMTAAHGINQWYGTNGHLGALVDQPLPGYTHGAIAINPAWQTSANCGYNPATSANFDYCTWADVALGTYTAGSTYHRKVRTSKKEGINGLRGDSVMNNTPWSVQNAVPPEVIFNSGNSIHKSGYRTGTTTGQLYSTCYWGLGGQLNYWPTTPKPWIEWRCTSIVTHIGWGTGDSGGPVFGRNTPGGTYYALGVVVGGTGATYQPPSNNAGICSALMACNLVFHKWTDIEYHFGFPLWAGT